MSSVKLKIYDGSFAHDDCACQEVMLKRIRRQRRRSAVEVANFRGYCKQV